jgi:hypothetical protein
LSCHSFLSNNNTRVDSPPFLTSTSGAHYSLLGSTSEWLCLSEQHSLGSARPHDVRKPEQRTLSRSWKPSVGVSTMRAPGACECLCLSWQHTGYSIHPYRHPDYYWHSLVAQHLQLLDAIRASLCASDSVDVATNQKRFAVAVIFLPPLSPIRSDIPAATSRNRLSATLSVLSMTPVDNDDSGAARDPEIN